MKSLFFALLLFSSFLYSNTNEYKEDDTTKNVVNKTVDGVDIKLHIDYPSFYREGEQYPSFSSLEEVGKGALCPTSSHKQIHLRSMGL